MIEVYTVYETYSKCYMTYHLSLDVMNQAWYEQSWLETYNKSYKHTSHIRVLTHIWPWMMFEDDELFDAMT